MKRFLILFSIFVPQLSMAGFVADEASWFEFSRDADGNTYYIDPYQTEYFDNGDVELLLERLKNGEKTFSTNPERLRFNCKSKKSYQSFVLNQDGSWKKVKDNEILNGSLGATWIRMACGEDVNGTHASYIATQIKSKPIQQYSVFYRERGKFYPTKIPDSKILKLYQWDWGTKESFMYLTVVNCKTKETAVLPSLDGEPKSWLPAGPKNSILGFVTFEACNWR